MKQKMPTSVWILVMAMALSATASAFLWPFNTLYIHDHLGESMTAAGVALFVNSGMAIIGNYLGGEAFDRIGGKKTLVVSVLLLLGSTLGFLLFHGTYMAYLVWLGIIGFSGGLVFPVVYAFAGVIWPQGGRRTFNAIYVAQNVGVAIGTAMSGQVARINIELIFSAHFALYVLFAVMLLYGLRVMNVEVPSKQTELDEVAATRAPERKTNLLWFVSIGYALLWFVYVQWQGTIAVHSKDLGVTIGQYSLLWTVNGAMIVFAQPLLNHFLRRFEENLKAQLLIGGIVFAAAFAVIPFAGSFSIFLVAMVVMTIGEMFVWPAVPTLAAKIAPKGKAGQYQGLVNIAASVGRMTGPTFAGIVFDLSGIQSVFVLIMILIGVALFLFYKADDGQSVKQAKTNRS